jgi:hypothetical protein
MVFRYNSTKSLLVRIRSYLEGIMGWGVFIFGFAASEMGVNTSPTTACRRKKLFAATEKQKGPIFQPLSIGPYDIIFYIPENVLMHGCTGCTVTPCSALSKASCQSLDDERRAELLPEGGGGSCWYNCM